MGKPTKKKAPYNLTFLGMGMGNFKAQLGILSCKPQKLATPKTKIWDCQNQTQGIQSCRLQTRGPPKAKNWEFQKQKKQRFQSSKGQKLGTPRTKNWELRNQNTREFRAATPPKKFAISICNVKLPDGWQLQTHSCPQGVPLPQVD